jgi:hypothetical protein
MRYSLKYSARILALILATVLGIGSAICFVVLVRLFFEAPGLIMRGDLVEAGVVGAGFLSFATLYVFLARKTRSKSPSGQ